MECVFGDHLLSLGNLGFERILQRLDGCNGFGDAVNFVTTAFDVVGHDLHRAFAGEPEE